MSGHTVIQKVQLSVESGGAFFAGAVVRYGLLDRLHKACVERNVQLLAFGFGEEDLRLVLEGGEAAIANVVRSTKVGVHRDLARLDVGFEWYRTAKESITDDLLGAVVWAHRAPIEDGRERFPESTPWSSHRDLLRFREAPFYDARVLEGRVDPREVHALAGGQELPPGWPPSFTAAPTLDDLLRVSAAVCGVLPTDRRCFRLFVHAGRIAGWTTERLAHALCLTTRRVRQLHAEPEPRIALAMLTAAHPQLRRVP